MAIAKPIPKGGEVKRKQTAAKWPRPDLIQVEERIMEIGEWIKAFREEKELSQRALGRKLNIATTEISRVERGVGTSKGYSLLAHCIEEFQTRPDDSMVDECLQKMLSSAGRISQHDKLIIKRAKRFPIWMPDGKEEKPMSKPETARGKTMLKIAERPEASQEEKDVGQSVALLREIKNLRKEIAEVSSYHDELMLEAPEPKTRFEKIKQALLKRQDAEIASQARNEALAGLSQELNAKVLQLTAARVDSLKEEMAKLSKHYQSILGDLKKLEAKIESSQDELNMIAWGLDNKFGYVSGKDS